MMSQLQIVQTNANHCKAAQDLLYQAVVTSVDIMIVAEPYLPGSRAGWHVDRAGSAAIGLTEGLACRLKEVVSEDGWVAVELVGVGWLMSTYFSPNRPRREFEKFLGTISRFLKQKRGPKLIAGDLNARSAVWGDKTDNDRGECLVEWMLVNQMDCMNKGSEWTCVRWNGGSIVDVTLCSPDMAQKVEGWRVDTSEETLSDHLLIRYEIRSEKANPFSKQVLPIRDSWSIREVDEGLINTAAEVARWVSDDADGSGAPGSLEVLVEQLVSKARLVCELALRKRAFAGREKKKEVYWWNKDIAACRKACTRLRRRMYRGRAKGLNVDTVGQELRKARKALKKRICQSKKEAMMKLCHQIEADPWGTPYRFALGKLRTDPPPLLSLPAEKVSSVLDTLFPSDPECNLDTYLGYSDATNWSVPELSAEEYEDALRKVGKGRKAPGPDGIHGKVWRATIEKFPELLARVMSSCFREASFPERWKKSRLVLLQKKGKPHGEPSSYRPLCLIDEIGKYLERLMLRRLRGHIAAKGGLSPHQFGFVQGRSTVDALKVLQASVHSAWEEKKVCISVALDIKNAFNSLPHKTIVAAMRAWDFPPYLSRMVCSFLSHRSFEYGNADGEVQQRAATAGVPQGSVLGPFLWNLAFDGVMRQGLPEGCRVVCFADDTLVLTTGETIEEAQHKARLVTAVTLSWIQRAGLQVAPKKTELVVFQKRKKQDIHVPGVTVSVGGQWVSSGTSMTYLGVLVDHDLNFVDHLRKTREKVRRIGLLLQRVLPNVGGATEARRKLYAAVLRSIALYGAPVWKEGLRRRIGRDVLRSLSRPALIIQTCAYRSVSTQALELLAGCPPVDLWVEELSEAYAAGSEARRQVLIEARTKTFELWRRRIDPLMGGAWTVELIGPNLEEWCKRGHGLLTFRLVQVLTGHGSFGRHKERVGKVATPTCGYCGDTCDDARHTLYSCSSWRAQRENMMTKLGGNLNPGELVQEMLRSEDSWDAVAQFCEEVMRTKEAEERRQELVEAAAAKK